MGGLEAGVVVLLTNVDGFFRRRPSAVSVDVGSHNDIAPELIPVVEEIRPDLKELADGPSATGRGGMVTKLEAAEIAMNCGGIAVVANGQDRNVLDRIFAGERVGTLFLPSKRVRGKRPWIASPTYVPAPLVVDPLPNPAIPPTDTTL